VDVKKALSRSEMANMKGGGDGGRGRDGPPVGGGGGGRGPPPRGGGGGHQNPWGGRGGGSMNDGGNWGSSGGGQWGKINILFLIFLIGNLSFFTQSFIVEMMSFVYRPSLISVTEWLYFTVL